MFINFTESVGKRRNIGIALLCIISLTVVFIFSQSMLPPAVSGKESDAVAGILSRIFSEDTPLGSFVINNIRKIGHFTEYGILGIEVSAFICIFAAEIFKAAPLSLVFAQLTAFTDESIQILSGRGSEIRDVWIDIFGFFTFSLIYYIIFYVVRGVKTQKDNSNG